MSQRRLADVRRRATQLLARDREAPEVPSSLYRRSMKATRGLAIAEALALIVLGFTLDDLGLLRFPGYVLATAGAILVLAGGRLVHGRTLSRRIAVHAAEDPQAALDAAKLRNTLAAVAAAIGFLAWLVVFASGVPPWML